MQKPYQNPVCLKPIYKRPDLIESQRMGRGKYLAEILDDLFQKQLNVCIQLKECKEPNDSLWQKLQLLKMVLLEVILLGNKELDSITHRTAIFSFQEVYEDGVPVDLLEIRPGTC